ncbi:hypothetical protein [Variovorax sp. E3]|uniref:hypothetical protein n=1 Tax=Variovorax sp. E3 TaxID=1914993 RepID=UPI0018DAF559|nr:hypothetical protein [Variovorax sp. E3]
MAVPAGNLVFAQSGGGGGWGEPLQRDPAHVLNDVVNDLVSIEKARGDYGVVIDAARLEVDCAATDAFRAQKRKAAKTEGVTA